MTKYNQLDAKAKKYNPNSYRQLNLFQTIVGTNYSIGKLTNILKLDLKYFIS